MFHTYVYLCCTHRNVEKHIMFLGMPWLFKSLIRFNLLSKIKAHSTSCSSPNISHVTTTVIADFFSLPWKLLTQVFLTGLSMENFNKLNRPSSQTLLNFLILLQNHFPFYSIINTFIITVLTYFVYWLLFIFFFYKIFLLFLFYINECC